MIVFSRQQKIEQEDHLQLLQLTASSGMRKTSCFFFFLYHGKKIKERLSQRFLITNEDTKPLFSNYVNKLYFVFGRLFGRIK